MYQVQPQYQLNDETPEPQEKPRINWALVIAGLLIGILIGISR